MAPPIGRQPTGNKLADYVLGISDENPNKITKPEDLTRFNNHIYNCTEEARQRVGEAISFIRNPLSLSEDRRAPIEELYVNEILKAVESEGSILSAFTNKLPNKRKPVPEKILDQVLQIYAEGKELDGDRFDAYIGTIMDETGQGINLLTQTRGRAKETARKVDKVFNYGDSHGRKGKYLLGEFAEIENVNEKEFYSNPTYMAETMRKFANYLEKVGPAREIKGTVEGNIGVLFGKRPDLQVKVK